MARAREANHESLRDVARRLTARLGAASAVASGDSALVLATQVLPYLRPLAHAPASPHVHWLRGVMPTVWSSLSQETISVVRSAHHRVADEEIQGLLEGINGLSGGQEEEDPIQEAD